MNCLQVVLQRRDEIPGTFVAEISIKVHLEQCFKTITSVQIIKVQPC